MHHKRGKPKNSRAGCLRCKGNKMNGWNIEKYWHSGFGKLRRLELMKPLYRFNWKSDEWDKTFWELQPMVWYNWGTGERRLRKDMRQRFSPDLGAMLMHNISNFDHEWSGKYTIN